jgi:hypothetical protein
MIARAASRSELRKLQPLLAGLPRSGERLSNTAPALGRAGTILVKICFGVIGVASLVLARDGSGGHASLWLALAIAVIAIVALLSFEFYRGMRYGRDVAMAVAHSLRSEDEPEHAIKNYLKETAFHGRVIYDRGRVPGPKSAAAAIESYKARADFWRKTSPD